MKTYLFQGERQDLPGFHEVPGDQHRACCLSDKSGDRSTHDTHVEHDDKQGIQHNVDDTADDQIVQRMSGISCGSQDSGSHIIDQDKDDPGKINPQINDGVLHDICRRLHESEERRGGQDTDQSKHDPSGDCHGVCIVESLVCCFDIPRSEELGNSDRGSGGESGKESHDQRYDLSRGAADAGESFFPNKLSHDHAVYGVVKLLEKGAQQDREEEQQKLFPDRPLCDLIFVQC